jgi:predicted NBD/HSP70 family sugar kinase
MDGSSRGSPQQEVRHSNERHVFHAIRQDGLTSRAALVRRTGLSAQAIGTIVRSLLELGIVEETGPQRRRSLGRHPVGVAIRPNGAYAFGCSVERDRLDAAWVDLAGSPLASSTVRLAPGEQPRVTVSRIEGLYKQLFAEAGLHSSGAIVLPAIGLGLPGPIDFVQGRLVAPPNFPHWEGVEPRSLFSRDWTSGVLLENSATAAALGEAWRSRGELANFLYCHWGLGIGGGLVTDFETYRGRTGNALELGHLLVVPEGALCGCGNRGCLEAEASVAALCRKAADLGAKGDFGSLAKQADDDPALADLFRHGATLLGRALAGVVNILDVDAVVLGGHHLREAASWIVPSVTEAVLSQPLRRHIRPVRVMCSSLGEAAGPVGAASVVFDMLLPSRRSASGHSYNISELDSATGR